MTSSRESSSEQMFGRQTNVESEKPILFNFKGPVDSFVGRNQQLLDIKDNLQGNRTKLVISAISGIGKTQLAKKYAQENLDNYGGNIFWIECENQQRFADSFFDLGKEVGVPMYIERWNLSSIIKEVFYHFKDVRCLFVLDNVEEGLEIDYFLETNSPNIHILITSKDKNWDQEKMQVLDLEAFSVDEAERFVKEILVNEDIEDIKRLVGKLNRLPLALAAAVYYIKEEKQLLEIDSSETYRITDYLDHYERNSEVLQLQNVEVQRSVFLALEMSYEKIAIGKEEFHKVALKLLKMFSYFSPNAIQIRLFKDSFGQTFLKAMHLLRHYSMIQVDEYKGFINIHSLTQKVTRIKANNNNEEEEILVDCVKIVEKLAKYEETNHILSFLNYACKYTSIINQFRESNFDILSIALQNSCRFGTLDDIKFLISKGANIHSTHKSDRNLLHLAAIGRKLEIIEFLIQKGFEIESLAVNRSTPLQLACEFGNLETVEFLISNDANIHSTNKYDRNVLHLAAAGGKIEIIEFLIQMGLEIESLDFEDSTPLQLACAFGNLETVKFLISKDANIHSTNKYDRNLLQFAAAGGKIEIIEFLIQKGYEIESLDVNRSTPLQLACQFGTLDVVQFLILKGANIKCTNKFGHNLLDVATKGKKTKIVDYLKDLPKTEPNG